MRRKIEDISIINEGLVIDGSVICDGRLIVRGTLKGSLSGENVVIAKTGAVSASVQAAMASGLAFAVKTQLGRGRKGA